MTSITRRGGLGALFTGAAAASLPAPAAIAAACPPAPGDFSAMRWARGVEGQRRADLGDGTFLNPIMAGDHPDPTILKDGANFYMTFSSFDAYPGVTIWRSGDLVNWTPLIATLKTYIGSVWACDLVKHNGRYFIYIPARTPSKRSIYVIHADHIEGPWSEPVDLGLPAHIDPGHAVGEDGKRYLFLSGGDRVRLSDDGLRVIGAPEHVYDPWRYPDDWDVEGFSPEGPKITRRGDYYYLITAVGGTAGPPTGHMVIIARSRSIHGPWENDPANPVVRTTSATQKWWSRGHASLVEGPSGDWWSLYHGYENGYWTLGRQALLDPIEWTADHWPRFTGGDLSTPIAKPRGGVAGPHGGALSDDFTVSRIGKQWSFHDPAPTDAARLNIGGGVLTLTAAGTAPRDSSPLTFICGDPAYQLECDIEIDEGAQAGLLLFYDRALYCGLAFNARAFVTHQYGMERGKPANPNGRRMKIRLTNNRHIVSFHTSPDGAVWTKFDRQMEVSGYHHNVRGGFLMLRPAIYASGEGKVRFSDFTYRALE